MSIEHPFSDFGRDERAPASESRERSGARGPRERACRGARRGEAPRILDERELAAALAAEGNASRIEAEPPSSARVWWRAQMRARQEAAQAANRPLTFVHAVAIACGVGLLLGLGTIALAWLRGTNGWLAHAYESLASAATPLATEIAGRWLALSLTMTLVSCIVLSVAAYVILSDE